MHCVYVCVHMYIDVCVLMCVSVHMGVEVNGVFQQGSKRVMDTNCLQERC